MERADNLGGVECRYRGSIGTVQDAVPVLFHRRSTLQRGVEASERGRVYLRIMLRLQGIVCMGEYNQGDGAPLYGDAFGLRSMGVGYGRIHPQVRDGILPVA